MKQLSKFRVAEDLKCYYIFMNEVKKNPYLTFREVYQNISKTIGRSTENFDDDYKEMVNVSIAVDYINSIGMYKDEFINFIDKDNHDIQNILSFLDSCFVHNTNLKYLNKIDLIRKIRNILFHSAETEKYWINSDGSININDEKQGLFLHLKSEDLDNICCVLRQISQRNIVFAIKDQQEINLNEILKDEGSCIKELKKIRIEKTQNSYMTDDTPLKIKDRLKNNDYKMEGNNNFEDYIIDKNQEYKKFEFSLNDVQCISIAKQVSILKKIFNIELMEMFLVTIIYDNLEFGILKEQKRGLNACIKKEFIINSENKLDDILNKLSHDIYEFIKNDKVPEENFFKERYMSYGELNSSLYKWVYIFLIFYRFFPYEDLSDYYAYFFNNFNLENDFEFNKIRNAFTHKRYCWIKDYFDISKSLICLYDNKDDINNPVSISTAHWNKTMNFIDFNRSVEYYFEYLVNIHNKNNSNNNNSTIRIA